MECKCDYCLGSFYKPSYDMTDSNKCRRCTIFLKTQNKWLELAVLIVTDFKAIVYDF